MALFHSAIIRDSVFPFRFPLLCHVQVISWAISWIIHISVFSHFCWLLLFCLSLSYFFFFCYWLLWSISLCNFWILFKSLNSCIHSILNANESSSFFVTQSMSSFRSHPLSSIFCSVIHSVFCRYLFFQLDFCKRVYFQKLFLLFWGISFALFLSNRWYLTVCIHF